MVAAVTGRIGQFESMIVSESSPLAKLSMLQSTVVYNVPADFGLLSQFVTVAVSESTPSALVSQIEVIVVYRGRSTNPAVRAWTFTQDGHDFYVLRLGTGSTLVYDTYSQQWSVYGSGETNPWRAYTGRNWQGGRNLALPWSDVIVGDDGNGSLYFLSPDDDTDDDPLTGATTPRTFRRQLTGQVVVKPGYASAPCYGVQLYGSIGSDTGDVTLAISDDLGVNYTDMGDVTLTGGEYNTRAHWRSLGSMVAPGRLFRITDDGALKRIDGLVMDD